MNRRQVVGGGLRPPQHMLPINTAASCCGVVPLVQGLCWRQALLPGMPGVDYRLMCACMSCVAALLST
jgi:hypothetical protein